MEQKIKQTGIDIGGNIRRVRKERGIGQTELVRMLQLRGLNMTRETLADAAPWNPGRPGNKL